MLAYTGEVVPDEQNPLDGRQSGSLSLDEKFVLGRTKQGCPDFLFGRTGLITQLACNGQHRIV